MVGTSNLLCVVVFARRVAVAVDEEDPAELCVVHASAQTQIPRRSVDNMADRRNGDLAVQLGKEEGSDAALDKLVWQAVKSNDEPRCGFILSLQSGVWAHMVHIQLDELLDLRCASKHGLGDEGN